MDKYDMIANTANDFLGKDSHPRVEPDEFQERLMELHPEFMSGVVISAKHSEKMHVRGVIRDYVGSLKRRSQRPTNGPIIGIEFSGGSKGEHRKYILHRSTDGGKAPVVEVETAPSPIEELPASGRVEDDRETLLRELASLDRTDAPIETTRRTEQDIVRAILLDGRREADCSLCGEIFENDYINACHIVQRKLLSEEERKQDPANYATLMCPLCDRAFGLGHVTVTGSDTIELADPAAERRHISHLNGRSAAVASDRQREYYARHCKQFTGK